MCSSVSSRYIKKKSILLGRVHIETCMFIVHAIIPLNRLRIQKYLQWCFNSVNKSYMLIAHPRWNINKIGGLTVMVYAEPVILHRSGSRVLLQPRLSTSEPESFLSRLLDLIASAERHRRAYTSNPFKSVSVIRYKTPRTRHLTSHRDQGWRNNSRVGGGGGLGLGGP